MTADMPAHDADATTKRPSLDGTAAAGEFSGIFANDPTTVTVRCGTCGATQAFAQLHAHLGGPGTVLSCRACQATVARVARTVRGTWLDISGSSSWLFLPTPSTNAPTQPGPFAA